jgi:hypothetical protein
MVLQQSADAHVSLANVLLATDFSAAAGTALPYAVAICRRYQGTLHIANAIPELGLLAQVETVSAEILNSGHSILALDAEWRSFLSTLQSPSTSQACDFRASQKPRVSVGRIRMT